MDTKKMSLATKADFTGLILVIPDKPDIERDAVAEVWEENGGSIIRIGRFWEPTNLIRERIRLYGNHIFCLVLAQKLDLELISPPNDLLINISENWLKRQIEISTLAEAKKLIYPCFLKSLVPKVFTARVFSSYEELAEECRQLEDTTPIIRSDIIEITAEVRSFVLDGKVQSLSEYEGKANLSEAQTFLQDFVDNNLGIIPHTCVVDIGYITGIGWAVLEANASWGAGLNGCNPLAAAICISEATKLLSEHTNLDM